MTPERWHIVEEIFQSAADLPAAERSGYLHEVCANEPDLRAEVEALLSQHDSGGNLLEESPYSSADLNALESLADEVEEEDPLIGRRLGAYRIEREIGRGGMGAVYEA